MAFKVLVTPTSFNAQTRNQAMGRLMEFADEVVFNPLNRPLQAPEVIGLLDGVDGYIAGLDYIDASVIQAAPESLKVISRYGAGLDRVDLAAAARRSIAVTNTPGANAEAVADMTLGLILAAARGIALADRQIRQGLWPRQKGMEIFGKKLGIIGLGKIGRRVARRARGFSMEILVHDPYLDRALAADEGWREVSLTELLKEAEVISLHAPLTRETRGLIGPQALELVRPGVVIVNTARYELLDQEAVLKALEEGRIGGLGLDVFDREPPEGNPFLAHDKVVLSPHAGSHTQEATERMAIMAVENLIAVLSGRDCPHLVGPPQAGDQAPG